MPDLTIVDILVWGWVLISAWGLFRSWQALCMAYRDRSDLIQAGIGNGRRIIARFLLVQEVARLTAFLLFLGAGLYVQFVEHRYPFIVPGALLIVNGLLAANTEFGVRESRHIRTLAGQRREPRP